MVTTLSFQGLGVDTSVNEPGVSLDNHLGKRRNDGGSKLAAVGCLRQSNVLVRVENDQRLSVVFTLSTRIEIVRVKGATLALHNNLVAAALAVLGVLREICETFVHAINDGGTSQLDASVEIKVGVTVQRFDEALG